MSHPSGIVTVTASPHATAATRPTPREAAVPHHTVHHFPCRARVPRAGRDPVRSLTDFLALVRAAASDPLRHEMLGLLLDDGGRGSTIVVVDDVPPGHDHAVLDLAEVLAEAGASSPVVSTVLLASVRPRAATADALLHPGDVDIWVELDDLVDSYDLRLVEWAVVGPAGVALPRELLGAPARW